MTHDDALKLIDAVNKFNVSVQVTGVFIILFLYFINANIRRMK